MEIRTFVPGWNLLQGECVGAGRRARFKGIVGLAAVAAQMSQDAVHNAGLGNDGNDLHWTNDYPSSRRSPCCLIKECLTLVHERHPRESHAADSDGRRENIRTRL
jgi:hypothetical protein